MEAIECRICTILHFLLLLALLTQKITVMNIPKGHQAVMPYLMLQNAHRFIEFTKHVFDAEKTLEMHREDGITIMHAEINIAGSTIMFSESTEEFPVQNANMFVYVDDADATYEKAISFNAITLRAPQDESYGRSCGVKDPFGNTWWITSV
jgi:uncharacterized glyoxalase superfamily protein PhnB